MSDDKKTVVGVLVSAMPIPIAGSRAFPCCNCCRDVWVSPAAIIASGSGRILCFDCFLKTAGSSGKQFERVPITEAQKRELAKNDCNLDEADEFVERFDDLVSRLPGRKDIDFGGSRQ